MVVYPVVVFGGAMHTICMHSCVCMGVYCMFDHEKKSVHSAAKPHHMLCNNAFIECAD